MTELRKGDAELHHPDGRHKDRFDFPFDFEKYERKIELHLAAHARQPPVRRSPDQDEVLATLADLRREQESVRELIVDFLRKGESIGLTMEAMGDALNVGAVEARELVHGE